MSEPESPADYQAMSVPPRLSKDCKKVILSQMTNSIENKIL